METTVEKKGGDAVAPEEVKKDTAASPVEVTDDKASEIDYLSIIADQEKELDKVRGERDNYKTGLLKAKGKLPDEDTEDIETLVDRKVAETLAAQKEAIIKAERDATVKKMATELREAKLALKNRTSNASGGSNQDKGEVKENFFSKEQVAALKARGLTDKQIEDVKKNYIDIRG